MSKSALTFTQKTPVITSFTRSWGQSGFLHTTDNSWVLSDLSDAVGAGGVVKHVLSSTPEPWSRDNLLPLLLWEMLWYLHFNSVSIKEYSPWYIYYFKKQNPLPQSLLIWLLINIVNWSSIWMSEAVNPALSYKTDSSHKSKKEKNTSTTS